MPVNQHTLINQFMTFFRVREKLATPYKWPNEQRFQRPFITIAREPGSGGALIADAVAKKLHFECMDENFIDEIARTTRLRREIIKAVDEKTRTQIEDMVNGMLNPDYIDDLKYITELTKIMITCALKGRVVIVGRGGNFATPFAKGLHVNITAPYEVRVKRAMDFEGFNREKAEEVIAATEKERKNFVKQYFRKDPTKINSYDLTLNTSYFSVEQARDVIIDAFYHKFPWVQQKVGILKVPAIFKR